MFEAFLWIVGIFFLLSFIFGGSSNNSNSINSSGYGFDDDCNDYYCDDDFSCLNDE